MLVFLKITTQNSFYFSIFKNCEKKNFSSEFFFCG
nr:MAG TPA: hypothetical protein [Caudoviricetes sp.]DAN92092.1 MAG TPA: hypothetical protein [Caudoviricetes sp.]